MRDYILFNEGQIVAIVNESPWNGTPVKKVFHDANGEVIAYDDDRMNGRLDSFEEAVAAAEFANKNDKGDVFVPYDGGHRYHGIVKLPKIGDDISKGFNGDYYYVGKVVKITPTLRVVVEYEDGGTVTFIRVRNTARWHLNNTWSMIGGVHNKLNPHF